jgi:DNA-binding transcriptional regulator GbsR (MarR family)
MGKIDGIKAEFLRVYETIAERRGLPIIFGRIMATFFLEGPELSQQELSKLIGYSLSSVSRALDQMIQMGIIRKHKNTSKKHFLYEMKLDYRDMAIGGIETWIRQAEAGNQEIKQIRMKLEKESFNNKEQSEVNRLLNLFESFEEDLKFVIDVIKKSVNEIKKL